MEYNDIYDRRRNLTGRTHLRGTPWGPGEYGLVVCVWVYDGEGKILLTKRAKEKTFPGTWENSGGAVRAGERSRHAVARELFEETGICADEKEFELLDSGCDGRFHYDYYCLKRNTPLSEIVLLPGETDGARWVTFEQIHEMIEKKEICRVIARQFRKQESMLLSRQNAKNKD